MTSHHRTGPDALAEEAARRLVRLHSDAVTDAERRDTEAWLAARPENRKAFDSLRAVWSALDLLPGSGAAAAAVPLPGHRFPGRRLSGRLAPPALLAAGLALAALFGPATLDRLRSDHSTVAGERRTVTLADGSQVQLNTDSAIAVDFSGRNRRVTLRRGEAFFTVTPDRSRPFEVVAMGAVTRVVGTRFAVRRMDEVTRVAVEEGTVEVRCPAGIATPEDGLRLTAGEAARYRSDACPTREAGVNVARATAWRDGRVVFDDRSLREVVDELNRYRPGPILLLAPDLAQRRVTGVFDIGDPDRALSAIEQVLPVRVRRVAGYLAIVTGRDG
ncbi:FecR family protein [Azospirillum thermophilum]|nr:FecR family protein [Azospirillum thermophilum]